MVRLEGRAVRPKDRRVPPVPLALEVPCALTYEIVWEDQGFLAANL